jgi:hypothetical protein
MGKLVVSESDQNYKYNNLFFSLEDILGSEYFLLWSYWSGLQDTYQQCMSLDSASRDRRSSVG